MKQTIKLFALGIFIFIAALVIAVRTLNHSSSIPGVREQRELPPVPASVTFRKALLGQGDVAQIKNTSGATKAFMVSISRPNVVPWKKSVVIDPGKIQEIGSMQGWTLAPGDIVEIAADGFQTARTKLLP